MAVEVIENDQRNDEEDIKQDSDLDVESIENVHKKKMENS